jgi:hypothetical protein
LKTLFAPSLQQRPPFVKGCVTPRGVKNISPGGAKKFGVPGFARPFAKG